MSAVTFNGNEYSEEAFAAATRVVLANSDRANITRDSSILNRLGRQYDGDRDVYDVLGYPEEIDEEDYRARYERQDIAERIVKLPANDTWRHDPLVSDDLSAEEETEFEKAIKQLASESKLFHYLKRTDRIAGLGEYGLLFIGLKDDAALSEAPNTDNLNGPSSVAFFSPFAQDSVETWKLGKDEGLDVSDPRYNKPVRYHIDFSNPDDKDEDLQWVHWQRVIHIAEDVDESDIKGTPRLKPVFNRLIDREKVIGSSAEMFWAGADRKLQFDINSEQTADIPEEELKNLDDEVQKLVHEMQNYIKTFNTDIEVIGGEEVDPTGVLESIDKSIAGQTGIPRRILNGSERGELASSQDKASWYGRVANRQNQFAGPMELRPTIDRLRVFGVVPQPLNGTYVIKWPNLFELNEVEQSEVWNNRAEAIERISPQGDTSLLGLSSEELFEFVVDGKRPDLAGVEPQSPADKMRGQE